MKKKRRKNEKKEICKMRNVASERGSSVSLADHAEEKPAAKFIFESMKRGDRVCIVSGEKVYSARTWHSSFYLTVSSRVSFVFILLVHLCSARVGTTAPPLCSRTPFSSCSLFLLALLSVYHPRHHPLFASRVRGSSSVLSRLVFLTAGVSASKCAPRMRNSEDVTW